MGGEGLLFASSLAWKAGCIRRTDTATKKLAVPSLGALSTFSPAPSASSQGALVWLISGPAPVQMTNAGKKHYCRRASVATPDQSRIIINPEAVKI